jgi:hypothetical protein
MARNLYGCTSADFTLTESGRVVAGATATVWTARTGGTQITDLTDLDGDAITSVTSDADGGIRFYGVDGDKDAYWLDTGTGTRIAVRPVNLTGETGPTPDLTIGTVTTGTAAATITGTAEDPVLNLTLPTAGANGVNTAAIQDGAVTSAKIADGTIVNDDINASAAIARSKISGLPTSSTDNTVARFDSTAGAIQTSGVVIDDNNRLTVATGATGGYGFASGAVHLSGTGSPEGVVTAAPGSTWLQTDATTDVKGWIRWVKATGTGNTGWVAGPEADTGVRNISYTSGLANWTAGTLRLRRMGNIVSVRADGVRMAAIGTIYNLPTGFKASPFGEAVGTVMREGAATGNPYWMAIVAANVANYGAALAGTFSATHRFYGEWVFQTADAWPSTLP